MACLVIILSIVGSSVYAQPNVAAVELYYKIKQVFVPEERRPGVEYNIKMVPFKNAGGQLSRVFQRGKTGRSMSGGFGRPRAAALKEPGKNAWRACTARNSTHC